jgi:hypothetical protein
VSWKCKYCLAESANDEELEFVRIGGNDVACRCPKCHRSIVVLEATQVGKDQYYVVETAP